MRSVGADKHKNAIQIKLAFAFFSLQRRITVSLKMRFILQWYGYPLSYPVFPAYQA